MLRRIYEAQKVKPNGGDHLELAKDDIATNDLNMTENEIARTPKHRFRKILKSKISNAAFKYLQAKQQGHSKMDNIKYDKFESAPYLNSPLFNNDSRSLLLALRTRTVRVPIRLW